jgi:hypothetical protein
VPAPCPKQRVAKPGGVNRSTEIIVFFIFISKKSYLINKPLLFNLNFLFIIIIILIFLIRFKAIFIIKNIILN